MNGNEFLLLHLNRDNSPAVVNVECIEQIYLSSEHKCTVVVFSTNDDDMLVKESVEKIYNAIESKKASRNAEREKRQLNS